MQRWSRELPCLICGGHDRLARGKGLRCTGFLDSSGRYAHCSREEFAGSLQPDMRTSPPTFLHRLHGDCGCGERHGESLHIGHDRYRSRVVSRRHAARTIEYSYKENGETQYLVRRYEYPCAKHEQYDHRCEQCEKDVRPFLPNATSPGLNGTRRILYNLDAIKTAAKHETVFWCEGEPNAQALIDNGLLATTYPGGAGKYDTEAMTALRDCRVAVLTDNDEPGIRGTEKIAEALVGIAQTVRIVPPLSPRAHGDVVDWLEDGHNILELQTIASRMRPLTDERQVPPSASAEFPVDALPPALRDLAVAAERAGWCVRDFVATLGLAVLGTVVGGLWEIVPEPNWQERAIIWTAIIGPSGSGKSPAGDAIMPPIRSLEEDLFIKFVEDDNDWQDQAATLPRGQRPPKPTPQRITINDLTTERLVPLLGENPHGLLWYADELRGLISGLNQYKSGRGNDRQRLLNLWNSTEITIDRVGEGSGRVGRSVYARRPTLCVTGGIQPAFLHELSGDDGMAPRFLLTYLPKAESRFTGEGIPDEIMNAWKQLIRRLYALRPDKVTIVRLDDGAKRARLDALNAWKDQADDATGYKRELMDKMGKHLTRLALVLWIASEQNLFTRTATVQAIQSARRICEYFLERADMIVFPERNLTATRAEQDLDVAVDRLVDALRDRSDHRLSLHGVYSRRIAGTRARPDVERLLKRFEETYPGCVERKTDATGRQQIHFVLPQSTICE